MKKTEKLEKGRSTDHLSRYAYYSGAGFQMIAVIGLFTYLGHRIDGASETDTPLWTAIFALIGVCLSIYTTIRMVTRRRS